MEPVATSSQGDMDATEDGTEMRMSEGDEEEEPVAGRTSGTCEKCGAQYTAAQCMSTRGMCVNCQEPLLERMAPKGRSVAIEADPSGAQGGEVGVEDSAAGADPTSGPHGRKRARSKRIMNDGNVKKRSCRSLVQRFAKGLRRGRARRGRACVRQVGQDLLRALRDWHVEGGDAEFSLDDWLFNYIPPGGLQSTVRLHELAKEAIIALHKDGMVKATRPKRDSPVTTTTATTNY